MKTSNRAHGAIYIGSNTVLVGGGVSNDEVEKCTISDSSASCVKTGSILQDFIFYPEMLPLEC